MNEESIGHTVDLDALNCGQLLEELRNAQDKMNAPAVAAIEERLDDRLRSAALDVLNCYYFDAEGTEVVDIDFAVGRLRMLIEKGK